MEVTSEHTMADAIIASYKAWERKPADVYPTPVDATESIMPFLDAVRKYHKVNRVWEPACGDGRMSRVLEWHGLEVISSDIRKYPGYGVTELDFLTEDPLEKWGWDIGEIDAVITNPPFSLAVDFIIKALAVAPIVIMLVKQNYWNTKGRLTLWDAHRPAFFMPITWRLAFLKEERGNSPLMDCAWAVWIRDFDEPGCFFEPIRKRVYEGYHGKGVFASLASLTEAVEGLGSTLGDREATAFLVE